MISTEPYTPPTSAEDRGKAIGGFRFWHRGCDREENTAVDVTARR